MLCDINCFKEVKVDQFVFGALTENQEIDEHICIRVLMEAKPHKVTFSRAFDFTRDANKSAGILMRLGFSRVLTSGQQPTANNPQAIQIIRDLAKRYRDENLVIMPGSGITPQNVQVFISMGCKIVHSTCRTAVSRPQQSTELGLDANQTDCVYNCDYNVVRQMKAAIADSSLLERN